MDKNRTNKLSQCGFIQIPFLIIIILGVLGVSTGGYFITKNTLKNTDIDSKVVEQVSDIKSEEEIQKDSENIVSDISVTKDIQESEGKIDLEKYKKVVTTDYSKEIDILEEKSNSLRELIDKVEKLKKENRDSSKLFVELEENIQITLDKINLIKNKAEISKLDIVDKLFVHTLDTREQELISDFNLQKRRFDFAKEIENEFQDTSERISSKSSIDDFYFKINSINNKLDDLPSLETGDSNLGCQFPTDKYILVPNKGWTKVKQCQNGTYIETEKYQYNNNSLTPEQQCAQRKAGALANNQIADCSDLGL